MVKCFLDNPRSVFEQMQIDRETFLQGGMERVFRIYTFSSFGISYGIFSQKDRYVRMDACEKMTVDVALRPTGGGVLFHGNDLAFSLYIPQKDPIYGQNLVAVINNCILGALFPYLKQPVGSVDFSTGGPGFCYGSATTYDLIWGGTKFGGGAQRRSKKGFLHQGSVFLQTPNWDRIEMVLQDKQDIFLMKRTITPLCDLLMKGLSYESLAMILKKQVVNTL